jgi:hypothetical protein
MNMVTMHIVQMPVMEIVLMSFMLYDFMPTASSVLMLVPFVFLITTHFCSPEYSLEIALVTCLKTIPNSTHK